MADKKERRIVWADGDDLVSATSEILTSFGFNVEDVDATRGPNDPKREDLRLTLDDRPGWEAIVEVKGYKKGTKANDNRQIRQHRDTYTNEQGRLPDLTLWIANPYRLQDPSLRPALDKDVAERSKDIGATYVPVPDLYRLWVLVADGSIKPSQAAHRLVDAEPGLWNPWNTI